MCRLELTKENIGNVVFLIHTFKEVFIFCFAQIAYQVFQIIGKRRMTHVEIELNIGIL